MLFEAEGVRWEIALTLPKGVPSRAHASGSPADDRGRIGPRGVEARDASDPQPLAGKRFLIVEDEPLVAMDVAAQSESAGGEIVGPAGNASAALRLIAEDRFDAALLDANLVGCPLTT